MLELYHVQRCGRHYFRHVPDLRFRQPVPVQCTLAHMQSEPVGRRLLSLSQKFGIVPNELFHSRAVHHHDHRKGFKILQRNEGGLDGDVLCADAVMLEESLFPVAGRLAERQRKHRRIIVIDVEKKIELHGKLLENTKDTLFSMSRVHRGVPIVS